MSDAGTFTNNLLMNGPGEDEPYGEPRKPRPSSTPLTRINTDSSPVN